MKIISSYKETKNSLTFYCDEEDNFRDVKRFFYKVLLLEKENNSDSFRLFCSENEKSLILTKKTNIDSNWSNKILALLNENNSEIKNRPIQNKDESTPLLAKKNA